MLTDARRSVLVAMRRYTGGYGRAPTLDELCKATGTKSVGSMTKHVNRLVADGYAVRDENGRAVPATSCPCCGREY